MLCVPPEIIASASPRRMISVASPMAWLLAAQAVRQFTFGPWALNRLAICPDGTLGSCSNSDIGDSISRPDLMNFERSSLGPSRAADHHSAEPQEILIAFAAAQVNAETLGGNSGIEDAGRRNRLFGRSHRELGVPPARLPSLRILADLRNVPVLDFRGNTCGETAGIEDRRIADAGLALFEPRPDGFHVMPHRVNHAHSGDDHTPSHAQGSLQLLAELG